VTRKKRILLEVIGVLGLIALLVYVLYGRILPEREALSGAIAKIPRPPNTPMFEIHGDDMETSFYFTAEYNDRSMEDIQAFYREFFTSDGWTDDFGLDEAGMETLEGLQSYSKGREQATITIIDIGGTLRLMASYRKFAYTHDEFANVVNESASPEAKALVALVREAYEGLQSYRDTGTYTEHSDGELVGQGKFTTLKDANGDLFFECQMAAPLFHKTTHVMSRQGNQIRHMSDYDDAPAVEDDISMAISALYGVTSCISGNIPELLLDLDNGTLFNLANLAILEDETLSDGTVCARLSGADFLNDSYTIWIGKEHRLIRQIESRTDKRNWSVTTYFPEPNAPIASEEIAFKPPVAR